MSAETANNQALTNLPYDSALVSQTRNSVELPPTNQSGDDFPNVPIRLFQGLYERAKSVAISSRHTRPQAEVLEALKAEATTAAADEYAEPFDTTRFEADRLLQEDFERNKIELAETVEAAQFAAREVDEATETLAGVAVNLKAPELPLGWLVVGSLVLAVSICPTLHDFIFASVDDELIKWVGSIVFAALFGGFISWGIVGNVDSSGERNTSNWAALAGGVLMGVGFGVLRLAYAEGISEIGFAVALTIVELATVLMLESKAASLRGAHEKFAEQQKFVTKATKVQTAKQGKHDRLQKRVKELETKLRQYIRHIKERIVRSDIARLKSAAEAAVVSGYLAGVNSNKAYMLGGERS